MTFSILVFDGYVSSISVAVSRGSVYNTKENEEFGLRYNYYLPSKIKYSVPTFIPKGISSDFMIILYGGPFRLSVTTMCVLKIIKNDTSTYVSNDDITINKNIVENNFN